MENGRKGKGWLAFLAEAHLLAVPAGCKTPPLYVQSVRCTGGRAVSTGLRAGRLGPEAPASQFGCNSHVIPT